MKSLLVIGLVFSLVFTSCKKTDSCNLTADSLVGSYKLTALTYKSGSNGLEDNLYVNINSCEKDNVFIFNSNNTFTYQDAGLQCNPASSDASGWSLIGTTLEFAGDVNTVTDFDCNTMVTTSSNPQGGILTATFIRL
jgi:hypothetical protein